MSKNYICYLNGPSSSGKSSITKELMKLLNKKSIYLSLDNIHDNLCSKYSNDNWELYHEEIFGLHRSAKVWYDLGFNVIIDSVLENDILVNDAKKVLPNSYFVGIFAPLDVLLQREESRGRNNFKLVKFQHKHINEIQLDYSLKLDSSKNSSSEIAKYIFDKLNNKYEKKIKIKPKLILKKNS